MGRPKLTLAEKQALMLAKHKPAPKPRPVEQVLDTQQPVSADALPNERETLAALWNRAQSGKQGATQAYKTYLEYLVGRAAQKPQQAQGPQLSPDTVNRITELATKLTAKCANCGHEVGGKGLAAVISGDGM